MMVRVINHYPKNRKRMSILFVMQVDVFYSLWKESKLLVQLDLHNLKLRTFLNKADFAPFCQLIIKEISSAYRNSL